MANNNAIAYSFASPADLAELYVKNASTQTKKVTNLNSDILAGKQIAEVESFTFVSNDNKYEVEAFLTKPVGYFDTVKYPLIVNIHGGPEAQFRPTFLGRNNYYLNELGVALIDRTRRPFAVTVGSWARFITIPTQVGTSGFRSQTMSAGLWSDSFRWRSISR